ncbi:IS21-like element helper ATPase IstB [Ktedonobacter racemifer]|uniref:IstB domain protein ATP-binding protein n=1 Tax=Ktedonobacter racemifer DSM 44963 TaxID=485913 RepID=D6TQ65_KTERA|nr:IS21-like element helper ATPase IstB [Ktedonobacter racemifer]EFH85713.1 IstB domain protein ATP-binding protein [Ktedonobacter racemifer DSM 44963]
MKPEFLLETYLKQLRLPSFAQSYQPLAQEAARTNLSYERYLLALAQEEVANREAHRIERAIQQAHFPVLKELADFEWSSVPSVPKARILELAQGVYITNAEPVILLGNPGLGKSHVATGLTLAACRQGRRVRFYNVAGLINDLIKAQQEYQLSRIMAQICKHELIVLDELDFIPFTPTGAQLLFQLCSALYERVAVIVTTNLHFAEWGRIMGSDERMSAALLDRLTHRATILEFVGTSYRFRQQLQHQESLGEGSGEPVAAPEV